MLLKRIVINIYYLSISICGTLEDPNYLKEQSKVGASSADLEGSNKAHKMALLYEVHKYPYLMSA